MVTHSGWRPRGEDGDPLRMEAWGEDGDPLREDGGAEGRMGTHSGRREAQRGGWGPPRYTSLHSEEQLELGTNGCCHSVETDGTSPQFGSEVKGDDASHPPRGYE